MELIFSFIGYGFLGLVIGYFINQYQRRGAETDALKWKAEDLERDLRDLTELYSDGDDRLHKDIDKLYKRVHELEKKLKD